MKPGPAVRVVPPQTLRWSIGADAPYVVEFAVDIEAVVRATATRGLGCIVRGNVARVLASRDELGALREELERREAHVAATALGRALSPTLRWQLRDRVLHLDRPVVMGIVNITDDSFSGDGLGDDPENAVARALALVEAGADIVDVGGESARADRGEVDPETEASKVAAVVRGLSVAGVPVSVDTYKPTVARAALEEGAAIVNDISGLTLGLGAAEEAAAAGAAYVLNYSYSRPKRRPDSPPHYDDVVRETLLWFDERLPQLWRIGLTPAQVAVDPGIAFGKSHDEDLEVLRRLGEFLSLGQPLLIAHSRKNFIGSATGRPPEDRDLETQVVTAFAYAHGARIFRVHDVAGARRALAMAEALVTKGPGDYAPDRQSWPWAAGAAVPHAVGSGATTSPPPGQRW